jgi:hypothetical protein
MATNSLIDKYNLLLKRGMPEHERLMIANTYKSPGFLGPDFVPTLVEWRWITGKARPGSKFIEVHPDDAQDLIEAHATRWFVHLDGEQQDWMVGYETCIGATIHKLDGEWQQTRQASTILDAIIAATAHLDGDGGVVK